MGGHQEVPREGARLQGHRRHAVVPQVLHRPLRARDSDGGLPGGCPHLADGQDAAARAPGREPPRLDHDAVDSDVQRCCGGQPEHNLPEGQAGGQRLLCRQGRGAEALR